MVVKIVKLDNSKWSCAQWVWNREISFKSFGIFIGSIANWPEIITNKASSFNLKLSCYTQTIMILQMRWLWTIFQHLCIASVQRISRRNVSYCEVQVPIFMTWFTLLWNSLYRSNTEMLKYCPKLPCCSKSPWYVSQIAHAQHWGQLLVQC